MSLRLTDRVRCEVCGMSTDVLAVPEESDATPRADGHAAEECVHQKAAKAKHAEKPAAPKPPEAGPRG
jgi:hypothetical protein